MCTIPVLEGTLAQELSSRSITDSDALSKYCWAQDSFIFTEHYSNIELSRLKI